MKYKLITLLSVFLFSIVLNTNAQVMEYDYNAGKIVYKPAIKTVEIYTVEKTNSFSPTINTANIYKLNEYGTKDKVGEIYDNTNDPYIKVHSVDNTYNSITNTKLIQRDYTLPNNQVVKPLHNPIPVVRYKVINPG